MSILSARDIAKAYGPRPLFSKASLTLRDRECVGLLGRNGEGKSTFLRVLAGLEPADEGVLERRRGARVLYLPQEPKLPGDATPKQVVEAGLAQWHAARARHDELSSLLEEGTCSPELLAEQAELALAIERLGGFEQGHRASEMLERLGIHDEERPLATLSGGELRRVALAQILVAQPHLAILDEPTNHLDASTLEFLELYLAERFGGSILLVTHDRYFLDAVADRIVELEHGTLHEYTGGYFDYLEQKAERLAHADRAEQNRQNLLRRERAWLMRGAKARTTKQKARSKRAHTLLAQEAPRLAARADLHGLEGSAAESGKTILELVDLSVVVARKTLITGLTLHMVQGERIGIIGPNGAGKTTLLGLVAGELAPSSGKLTLGARTKLAYFDQARSDLRDDWSVFDNVAGREGAVRDGGGQVRIGDQTLELRAYLERFLFAGSKQRQKVSALSGGERARVALAKSLREGANLLLLDEPTNDLDVAMLAELEELLLAWPGCVLAVSHDRAFLDRIATSILAFEGEGRVVRYVGDYESYREQRAAALSQGDKAKRESQKSDKRASSAEPGSARPEPTSSPKPLTYAERIELEGILARIEAAEAQVAQLEATLGDPATYTKGKDTMKQLQDEYAAAKIEVQQLTARWEELESRSGLRAQPS